ncbi:Proline dehydrogenase [Frankia sp. Hr75.2]|nr:Proline dehydrogenase [Frankia sp. Hr75.2]
MIRPGTQRRAERPPAAGRARELAGRVPAARALVDRLDRAGAGPVDALARAAQVADARVLASIDRVGPVATDAEAAGATTASYLTLLDLADRAGIADDLDISLRLAAVGQAVPRDGAKIAHGNAAEICARAREVGATVTLDIFPLDAAEPAAVDAMLVTLSELRRDVPATGAVLRTGLARTVADCRDLARPGCRVRLCPGPARARQSAPGARRARLDRRGAFASSLGVLMAGPGYPMVATDDPGLIALTARLAMHVGRRRDSFEFQALTGMLGREHRRLAAEGYRTRAYVGYGPLRPARAR